MRQPLNGSGHPCQPSVTVAPAAPLPPRSCCHPPWPHLSHLRDLLYQPVCSTLAAMPARHFHNHLPDYAPGNQVAVNVAHTLQTFSAVLQDVLKAPTRKPSVYTGVGGMPLARAPLVYSGEGPPLNLLQYADVVPEPTDD